MVAQSCAEELRLDAELKQEADPKRPPGRYRQLVVVVSALLVVHRLPLVWGQSVRLEIAGLLDSPHPGDPVLADQARRYGLNWRQQFS
jgi:hypothetical protein